MDPLSFLLLLVLGLRAVEFLSRLLALLLLALLLFVLAGGCAPRSHPVPFAEASPEISPSSPTSPLPEEPALAPSSSIEEREHEPEGSSAQAGGYPTDYPRQAALAPSQTPSRRTSSQFNRSKPFRRP